MTSYYCCGDFTTYRGNLTYIITSKYSIAVVNMGRLGPEMTVLLVKSDKRPFSLVSATDVHVPGWHTMIFLTKATQES